MNHAPDGLETEDMDLIATAVRESASEDARLLAEATDDDDPNKVADAAPAAPAPSAAAPTPPAPAQTPAAAAPAAPAAPAPDSRGDLTVALRASRHETRLERAEKEALIEENKQLRARVAEAPATSASAMSDEDLETLKDYDRKAYDAYMAQRAELELLRRAAPAPTAPAAAFRPQFFNEETMAAIDQVPTLAAWHATEADQPKFEMVKRIDAINELDPAWQGKSSVERFNAAVEEVVRRFSAAAPSPSPSPTPPPKPKTMVEAEAIIAQLTHQAPQVRTGDLNGGVSPSNVGPDPYAMVQAGKTDEEIIASLARLG